MKCSIDESLETLDDLMCGYSVIQPINGFRFSIDSVLLAHFASVRQKDSYCDICSGSGVVAFLVKAHKKPSEISCVEIQETFCNMIARSASHNDLESVVKVYRADTGDLSSALGYGSMDAITCNPPYLKDNTGKKSDNESVNIAKREVLFNLEDTIAEASKVLKNKGRFSMVHIAERADEIFELMAEHSVPVKRARMIQPNVDAKPNLILVEGIKNASRGVEWLPALNVYDKDGYTKEVREIYGGEI